MKSQKFWPVYKGASFDIWQPETGEYYAWADPDQAQNHLFKKRIRQAKTKSSAFYGLSQEYLQDRSNLPCLAPRIAFRAVTCKTNRRTMLACLIPPKVFLTHQAAYLFFNPNNVQEEAYTLGVLCSVPFDWHARRVVETNFGFHIFNNCPVPRPPNDHHLKQRVIFLAGCLAAVDERFDEWAKQVGVPVGSATAEKKADMIAELDAAVALLYGLNESDLRIIYDTFHTSVDHLPNLETVLGHHRNLR